MRPQFVILIASLLLAGCGDKIEQALSGPVAGLTQPASPGPMNAQGPVIVMLGDSLTAGFQLPQGNALPAALQRVFDDRDIPAQFVNAGVSGDTTADGLARYDWSVKDAHADLLVVALGANDFLNDLPADTPRRNLQEILQKAKADSLPAALVGVTIPGDSRGEREAAFAAIYPDLAKEFGVPYYANILAPVAGRPDLLQEDGLHPSDKGVEAMADALAGFLEPLVKDLT